MRVIAIKPLTLEIPDADSCSEDNGEVPKMNLPLARRSFLKGSGILMGTLATGSVLAALAPSRAWALELKQLSKSEGQTLMAMGRVLYPHKKLPDAVYAWEKGGYITRGCQDLKWLPAPTVAASPPPYLG